VSDTTSSYRYRARLPIVYVVFAALCVAGALFMWNESDRDDHRVVVGHVVTLDREGSATFERGVAIVMIAAGALFAWIGGYPLLLRPTLRVGPTSITIPRLTLWRPGVEIRFDDISALSVAQPGSWPKLHVTHSAGADTIDAAMLPSSAAFDAIRDELASRTRLSVVAA